MAVCYNPTSLMVYINLHEPAICMLSLGLLLKQYSSLDYGPDSPLYRVRLVQSWVY